MFSDRRRGDDHLGVAVGAGDLLELLGQAAADTLRTRRCAHVEDRQLRDPGPQVWHDDTEADQPSAGERTERDPASVDVVLERVHAGLRRSARRDPPGPRPRRSSGRAARRAGCRAGRRARRCVPVRSISPTRDSSVRPNLRSSTAGSTARPSAVSQDRECRRDSACLVWHRGRRAPRLRAGPAWMIWSSGSSRASSELPFSLIWSACVSRFCVCCRTDHHQQRHGRHTARDGQLAHVRSRGDPGAHPRQLEHVPRPRRHAWTLCDG